MEEFSAKKIFKDIRNFLAGRFLGGTRDEFLLEELIKLIFCKFYMLDENTESISDINLSSIYRKIFKSIIDMYEDIYDDKTVEIELDPISIKYIDSKLNTLNITNLERDIIGDAYEVFIGEMIKGQSGQFFTPQNAAMALIKMIQPKPNDNILDLTCGAGGFLISTLKYWNQNQIHYKKNNFYGIDKDSYLTRLAKIHLACMKQSTKNIKCSDSLVWDKNILNYDINKFDIILTNPPFGTNIKTGSEETLQKYQLAYKYKQNRNGNNEKTDTINLSVPPQVVFIEQCINLTKENGYIGIVVPESLISNKKYSYVVDFIFTKCFVKAVIGMPDELFKTSGKGGTHTKTCLLILQIKSSKEEKEDEIFMAEAKWCGHDSRGRDISKDDIPQIIENYLSFQNNGYIKNGHLGFTIKSSDITNKVLAPRAYMHDINNEQLDLSQTHNLITIGNLIKDGILSVATGNEVGKLAYGSGNIPFIRTSDISNWEIKSDPKHLISEEVYQTIAKKQDIKEGDILMVKDGSYLIGSCAMITKEDTKIAYQSHLYKIRVKNNNKYNFDNYYLLAALSSTYVKQQISSKTYSNDIINSLGDRLKDIVIPIKKDLQKSKNISEMVKQSIENNRRAKELSKKSKESILT